MRSLSRRRLLAALVVAGTAGCQPARPAPGRPPAAAPADRTPAAPDPQWADLAAERQLLAAYVATAAAHPALSARLAPVRADHVAHVRALELMLGVSPSGSTASPRGPSNPQYPPSTPPPTPAAPTVAVPVSPAAAIAALRTAELTAAAARAASCLSAATGRAALLASIAACEASHQVLLS